MPSPSVDRYRFAFQLRGELNTAKMSVGELARRIDPDNPKRGQRTIRRWLSGKHAPSEDMLTRVAAAFAVDVATFRSESEKAA